VRHAHVCSTQMCAVILLHMLCSEAAHCLQSALILYEMQVGILQFSNDVRVEISPQAVDDHAHEKTLQTMVSSIGEPISWCIVTVASSSKADSCFVLQYPFKCLHRPPCLCLML
jgi:hypothetical protein